MELSTHSHIKEIKKKVKGEPSGGWLTLLIPAFWEAEKVQGQPGLPANSRPNKPCLENKQTNEQATPSRHTHKEVTREVNHNFL